MSVYSTLVAWQDADDDNDDRLSVSRHPYEKHYRFNVNDDKEILFPLDVIKAIAMAEGWLPMDREWFKKITDWGFQKDEIVIDPEVDRGGDDDDLHYHWWGSSRSKEILASHNKDMEEWRVAREKRDENLRKRIEQMENENDKK